MMKNPFIFNRAKDSNLHTPENQSKGILDDYAVRKNVATREGTIEKVPVNDSDIVNKKYCDSNAGGGAPVTWGDITASGSNVIVYNGVKTVSGAVQISATGGTAVTWGDVTVSGSGLVVYGGTKTVSGGFIIENTGSSAGALLLDQSTPQIVSEGIPTFASGAAIGVNAQNKTILYPSEEVDAPNCEYLLPVDIQTGYLYCDGAPDEGAAQLSWITTLPQQVPTGSITMWTTDTAPDDWLLCRGQAVSESTYAGLFAVIGHNFGGDPGGGNFNVPDLRASFPYGAAAAGEIGMTGGSTSYTPTGTNATSALTVTTGAVITTASASGHTHIFTGNAATIIPPYVKLNFIIRT